MINVSSLKSLMIPEGEVVKIVDSKGNILWEKLQEIVSSRLPTEYQEVEWVQAASDIGAYLNLGFTFDTSATVRIGMYCVDKNPSYLFGAAENNGIYRFMISAPYGGGADAYAYGSSGSTHQAVSISLIEGELNDIEYSVNSRGVALTNKTNGNSVAGSSITYTMTSDLFLFAQNYNGSVRYGAHRKIKYFQYFDKNGDIVCYLVPCYRKSDGVIGMYDMVRKLFLANVGTGNFTKGDDVQITNQVLLSTEEDDSTIYNNGLGYKDGCRVRSGGAEVATETGSCTGFIKAKAGGVVRLAGFNVEDVSTNNAINVYDVNHSVLGQIVANYPDAGYGLFTDSGGYIKYGWGNEFGVKQEKAGVYAWTLPPVESIAYIRVTGSSGEYLVYPGSTMIVTINEDIEL